jgi:AcrR family transcriptional regulator
MKHRIDTKTAIIEQAVMLLASGGPSYVSLRRIGQGTQLAQSAVYHHFQNKEALLEATFIYLGLTLRTALQALPPVESTHDLLVQRLQFQFDHADLIVATLKYFVDKRLQFPELATSGYIPAQAYQHIIAVIERGNVAGEWNIPDPRADAKVIVHAINGFVLEYYPAVPMPAQRQELIDSIASFVWRALTNPSNTLPLRSFML